MKGISKLLLVWLIIGALILVGYNYFLQELSLSPTLNLNYSEFLSKLENNEVVEVVIEVNM
jgi:hypothetical protein